MQVKQAELLIVDYLEGVLSTEQAREFELCLEQSEELRQEVAFVNQFRHSAQQWQEQKAPKWHRHTHLFQRTGPARAWWPAWLSLATSAFAIALVLTSARFEQTSSGFQLSFGSQAEPNAEHIAQLVDARIRDFQKQQDTYLSARLYDHQLQQQEMVQTRLTAAVSNLRQERQRDLVQLTSYWQSQMQLDEQKDWNRYYQLSSQDQRQSRYLSQLLRNTSTQPNTVNRRDYPERGEDL